MTTKQIRRMLKKQTITKRTFSTRKITTCTEESCTSMEVSMRELFLTWLNPHVRCMQTRSSSQRTSSLMRSLKHWQMASRTMSVIAVVKQISQMWASVHSTSMSTHSTPSSVTSCSSNSIRPKRSSTTCSTPYPRSMPPNFG